MWRTGNARAMAETGDPKRLVDAAESERSRNLAPSPPRQSGIDRFDEAIVVTRTRAWIGLLAALAMVAGVIVWASLARVDQTVESNGVALVNGSFTEIHNPADGVVTRTDVAVGGMVTMGQTVGAVTEANGVAVPIVSRVDGQVVRVNAVGAHAYRERIFALIAQTNGPVVVRTFLPTASALKVRDGTPVNMNFTDEGNIEGTVTEVGHIPLTAEEVSDSLGAPSEALAQVVGATDGEAISVVVTPTHTWSSGFHGIDYGSLIFIYGHRHPINFVF